MKRWSMIGLVRVVLCGLPMVVTSAHAGDGTTSAAYSAESFAIVNASQTYVWDFFTPSSIRAGATASIPVEAWSEANGSTTSSIQFYLSRDSRLDLAKDKLVGSLSINLTGPTFGNNNSLFVGTVSIPKNTTAGRYFIFLTIDGRERTRTGAYFVESVRITGRKKRK
jgi:hypothetical protein